MTWKLSKKLFRLITRLQRKATIHAPISFEKFCDLWDFRSERTFVVNEESEEQFSNMFRMLSFHLNGGANFLQPEPLIALK